MTARAAFTQAAIERAIKAAEKRGYKVGGVRPDGTVLVYVGDERPEALSIVPPPSKDGGSSWDDR